MKKEDVLHICILQLYKTIDEPIGHSVSRVSSFIILFSSACVIYLNVQFEQFTK